jgi:hypothetical protein
MADGTEKNEDGVRTEREEIFAKSVRAGKRTYFFDVKTTRRNDYYLTLTESKKRFNRDGRFYFEKHKIFLYKEDFEKFIDGLTEAIDYIKANAPEILDPIETEENFTEASESIEDVKVEDSTSENTGAENDSKASEEMSGETIASEVGEPITEDFSNVEFEDLEDSSKS